MIIDNNIYIKSNLLNSDVFVVENNDILTIDKRVNINNVEESSPVYECIILVSDERNTISYMINQIVYNPYTKELNLLNTKRIHSVIDRYKVDNVETVTMYEFNSNKVLIIFDEEKRYK